MARTKRPSPHDVWARIALAAKRRRVDLASRRLPARDEEMITQYAQSIGLVIWASNHLHASVFEIFWSVLGRGNGDQGQLLANGLWHQIQSDSIQRDMLVEAARAKPGLKAAAIKRIEWIVWMANRLGTYRNVAAHIPMFVFEGRPMADAPASRLQAGLRFQHINHATFWRVLMGDMLVLAHYARRVAAYPNLPALQRKPTLRSLREIQKIEQALSLQTQRRGRPRRVRSSRPKPSGRAS